MSKQQHKPDCLFCQIVSDRLKSWKIYENKQVLVFLDVSPLAKGHCLVVTKKCHKNLLELNREELLAVHEAAQEVIKKLKSSFQPTGFNLINNVNKIAGQEINHYHLHIIPKYEAGYGFILQKNVKEKKQDLATV